MVTLADVCPSCGGRHEEGRRRGFWERSEQAEWGCPYVVHGPFPMLMKVPEPPAALRELPGEIPFVPLEAIEKGPADASGVLVRKTGLPIPWPRPVFDEVYP